MFDAVIFDLDGTLIDTESVAMRVGVESFVQMGLPADQAIFHSLIGKDAPTSNAILCAAYPQLDLEELNRLWRGGFEAAIATDLPLKPGARDLLNQITLPMAICTSSHRDSAHVKLDKAGIAAAFRHVVTLEDVQNAKPHPEPYLLAAALLGADPARCLVFEDSEPGAEAARAAGCTVIQVPDILPTDGRHAHHVARDLINGARLVGLI